MITIHCPQLVKEEKCVKLEALIDIDGVQNTIWFQVNSKYENFLCWERSDAFVIGILNYAMRHKHDIVCHTPITQKLFFQLNNYFIDTIAKSSISLYRTQLISSVEDTDLPNAKAVGTGISCGVDSLYTVQEHTNSLYPLTHLALFNVGSNGEGERAKYLYAQRKKAAEEFCSKNNFELVCIDSNIMDVINQSHLLTVTYTACAAVFALQKLFGIYYLSSGYPFWDFNLKENDKTCPESYDLFTFSMFSINSLTFYSDGGTATRIEKIEKIIQYPPSYQFLNVCTIEANNCSCCEKCGRTLLALDALNALDLYKNVFNIEYYKKHRIKYYSQLYTKAHDKSCPTYEEYKKMYSLLHSKIGILTIIYSYLNRIFKTLKKMRFAKQYIKRYIKR